MDALEELLNQVLSNRTPKKQTSVKRLLHPDPVETKGSRKEREGETYDVGQDHPSTAVPLELQSIQRLSATRTPTNHTHTQPPAKVRMSVSHPRCESRRRCRREERAHPSDMSALSNARYDSQRLPTTFPQEKLFPPEEKVERVGQLFGRAG